MEFTFYVKPTAIKDATLTSPLIDRAAAWEGSVADWGGVEDAGAPITKAEIAALKQSHGTKTANVVRAMRVKQLMMLGKTPLQIHFKLRGHGQGYSLSAIKHDHAALAPLLVKSKKP